VVSEMLGHFRVSITLCLCTHVMLEMQQDASRPLNRLFTEEN
jgi:hypothetical protein